MEDIADAYYTYVDGSGELRSVSGEFLQAIRKLRKEQTSAEKILWECLRNRRLDGYKFRRQFPIMGYVVDFYCLGKCLSIEIDGSIHQNDEVKEKDQERQRQLEDLGVIIIRFTNDEVYSDTIEVLRVIHNKLKLN